MDFLKLLKKWLRSACVWYAVVSLLMLCIGVAVGSGSSVLSTKSYLMMFPFGLCMSAAGMLYRSAKIDRWLRILAHYAISIVAFLLFLLLPNENPAVPFKASFVLIMIVLLSVVYWLLFLFVHIFRKRLSKLLED
ncbi:MAG: hypothetical protein IJW30_05035 [Clostridia bacterium]|nr:hypothetical protein [Clostridia bacterium]